MPISSSDDPRAVVQFSERTLVRCRADMTVSPSPRMCVFTLFLFDSGVSVGQETCLCFVVCLTFLSFFSLLQFGVTVCSSRLNPKTVLSFLHTSLTSSRGVAPRMTRVLFCHPGLSNSRASWSAAYQWHTTSRSTPAASQVVANRHLQVAATPFF